MIRGLWFVDGPAARARTADTTLVVGMQRRFVIDRDLFARLYVAQCDEENVVIEYLHESVWTT